ncbi:hypothetical protein Fmac_002496 [Flemingia macrophylla]|uniref:Major facilitator superfamily (MFS) profile domain-containing protein n=1 Tax=Flemingia macrophylla TaxID=520843 RepID=A0ABD1NKQ6_9FABA
MSGALIFIKEDLQTSDLQIQLLVGMSHVCALPASLVAGRTSDYIGRRYTIILASIAFLLGSALMGYSPFYSILMIGNCIVGVGVAFALAVAPVYSTEISPTSSRGFLTSLPTLSLNTGLYIKLILSITCEFFSDQNLTKMSKEEETNGRCQLSMENVDENEDNHGKLNKYAFASVMAASIISVVFGYGE